VVVTKIEDDIILFLAKEFGLIKLVQNALEFNEDSVIHYNE